MRAWWRRPLPAGMAVLAMLVAPGVPGATGVRVLAHAQLVASSPAAGVTVPESPPELRLVFSEPLEAQLTSLDVVVRDGTAVLDRAGEIDPNDPYALVVIDPQLPDGVYSLTWRTLSAADGHTAEGFFTFGVGEVGESLPQAAGGGITHTEADPMSVVGRWLTYVGLLLAFGIAVFHRVVIRSGRMPAQLVRLLAGGLGLSALATLGMAIVAGLDAGSVPEYLLISRNGALQLGRAGVAAIGAGALLVLPARHTAAVAGATGLVGIVLLVAAGHAAALAGPVPIIAHAVHVAAAAIWIGGLIGLFAVAVRPALIGADPRPSIATIVPRFSALALASIGLVALTGVYAAWMQTGELVSLDTEYGRTLIIKSVLAFGAFALGGLNFFDGGRMLGWMAGFRSRLRVEVMLAGAVLVVTAVLATTPPVEEVSGVAIEPIPDAFGEVAPGMRMEIVPGRPGVNRVVVETTDGLSAAGRLELVLERLDNGSTTRVPLGGMAGMTGMDHGSMQMGADDGTVDWVADALVLPAGSRWDTSVRILSGIDVELSRQRFAFTLSEEGIEEGRVSKLLEPPIGIAALLLLGGALGLGLGLGGMSLPRCEPAASRVALIGGGLTGVVLGIAIGTSRLLG